MLINEHLWPAAEVFGAVPLACRPESPESDRSRASRRMAVARRMLSTENTNQSRFRLRRWVGIGSVVGGRGLTKMVDGTAGGGGMVGDPATGPTVEPGGAVHAPS
jgi:hypothetical protein